MIIAFVQVKKWEESIIRRKLKGNVIKFLDEPLDEKNVSQIANADILSVFIATRLDKKLISKFKKLKLIVTRSTGFDHIDIKSAKKAGIIVANIPSYGENTVAEHTFALVLALSRNVHKSYLRTLKKDYSVEGLKGFDLKNKVLGVLGAGNIGKHVIRIGRGFEMDVLAYDHHPDEFLAEEMNFKYTSIEEVLRKADILSLHVPYNKANHHMINKKVLKKMKKGAILINTSRGGLIDTEALIWALKNKRLAGVGLDVIEGEELIKEEKQLLHDKDKRMQLEILAEDHELLAMDNVVFTPHIGFLSQEALDRIIHQTIQNIKDFLKDRDVNEEVKIC